MTNSIFRITPTECHIDTLILEPSWSCARSCQGCYSRAHKQEAEDLDWYVWRSLLWTFLLSARHSTNQISISINDRIDAEWNGADELLDLNYKLTRTQSGHRPNTHIHLTLFSPSTIEQYVNLTMEQFAAVDAIYFSNIREEEADIIKALRAKNKNLEIGWNYRLNNSIKMADLSLIDSIYRIEDKTERSKPFLFWPAREGIKQIPDICWIDYTNWKQDWHHTTCSANISKFTVWPDGSISGCPYAKQSNTGPAKDASGILENIYKASKQYDFNNCIMKEIYGSGR